MLRPGFNISGPMNYLLPEINPIYFLLEASTTIKTAMRPITTKTISIKIIMNSCYAVYLCRHPMP